MKQLIIYLCGLASILVALSGAICAVQAIVTGIPFIIICAVIFLLAWVYIVIDWFKADCPTKVGDVIYNKLF